MWGSLFFIDQFRLFVLAVRFYTRAPVVGRASIGSDSEPQRIAQATRYFPLVGLLVGVIVALTYMLSSVFITHSVAVLLAVSVGVLMTGAFHEVDWANFCNGIGGAGNRERTLDIMTDSRISAFGAIGLVLLLLLKIETLASLDDQWTPITLVCAHPFSRACAVFVMTILPYARSHDESNCLPDIWPQPT